LNLPSYYGGFNHTLAETVDEIGGGYSVSETWLVSSGSALEEFSVSSRNSLENGRTEVTIEGSIVGLEVRENGFQTTTTKYTNALNRFNSIEPLLLVRASGYAQTYMNAIPTSKLIGRNPVQGTINYTLTYDNRPAPLIANSKSESILITDNNPVDVFASIFVLGKQNGPVLQDLNSQTASQRSVSIEVVMDTAGSQSLLANQPNYDDILNAVQPGGTVYFTENVSNWDPIQGRGSRRVTWTY
jgi:hypothetical protein